MGGERIFKVVSFYLVRYRRGRLGDIPPEFRHEVAEARWLPLEEAPRLLAYKGEREMAEKRAFTTLAADEALREGAGRAPCTPSTSTRRWSPTSCAARRKTATIRLGDKSGKYKKGMVVSVLVGVRFSPARRSSTR